MNKLKEKRLLILGAGGFLGTYLVKKIIEHRLRFTAVFHHNPPALMKNAITGTGNIFKVSDLTREKKLTNLFKGHRVIYNFAGRSGATISARYPRRDFALNTELHGKILEYASRLSSPPVVILPSTQLVYGTNNKKMVKETDEPEPASPYALNKLLAEHISKMYAKKGVYTYILRITNPYGYSFSTKRYTHGILNYFIQRAVSGEPIRIFGDGRQKRGFLHTDDLMNVFLRCAEKEITGTKTFNVSGDEYVSINDAARTIQKFSTIPVRIEHVPWPQSEKRYEPGDIMLSTTRVKKFLKWKPCVNIKEGIKKTLDFYLE